MPMLYQFRVTHGNDKTFALQQPFATLFDNLIAVLWSVYGKKSTIQIGTQQTVHSVVINTNTVAYHIYGELILFNFPGINQLQWALEFLKCMKVDYNYPASIVKIVNELEERLIKLYAKVGEKIQDDIRKKEMKQYETGKENNSKSKYLSKYTSEKICNLVVFRKVSELTVNI